MTMTTRAVQEAVLIFLKLSDDGFGEFEEREAIFDLEERLELAVKQHAVGEYDGHELGDGWGKLYLYGPGARPYALTYASTDKARVGALISAPAFWKQQVARFRSTSALDGGQAERRLERGDDDVKQESCHAPVADRA